MQWTCHPFLSVCEFERRITNINSHPHLCLASQVRHLHVVYSFVHHEADKELLQEKRDKPQTILLWVLMPSSRDFIKFTRNSFLAFLHFTLKNEETMTCKRERETHTESSVIGLFLTSCLLVYILPFTSSSTDDNYDVFMTEKKSMMVFGWEEQTNLRCKRTFCFPMSSEDTIREERLALDFVRRYHQKRQKWDISSI